MIANKAATISMLVLKYLISNIINNVGLLVGGYDVPIPHRHSGDSAPVKGLQVSISPTFVYQASVVYPIVVFPVRDAIYADVMKAAGE